jgi:hypothetical protein
MDTDAEGDNAEYDFKNGHYIEVMVNRTVKGKAGPDTDWARYHAAFRLERLTPYGLAVAIYRGYGFCPVYEGTRKQSNFRRSWHIAFDLDSASLAQAQALDWVDYFASFGYTTPSHTAERPKCRIVFVFDQPISDTVRYRDLYHALAWRFQTDGIETDPACKDLLRLYFGSPGCEVWGNWSVLAGPSQDVLIRQWREAVPERPRPAAVTIVLDGDGDYERYVEAIVDGEMRVVREAPAGKRHAVIFKAGAALGSLVASPWAKLEFGTALDSLLNAATWADPDVVKEIRRVMSDGIRSGMQSPRLAPGKRYEVESVL